MSNAENVLVDRIVDAMTRKYKGVTEDVIRSKELSRVEFDNDYYVAQIDLIKYIARIFKKVSISDEVIDMYKDNIELLDNKTIDIIVPPLKKLVIDSVKNRHPGFRKRNLYEYKVIVGKHGYWPYQNGTHYKTNVGAIIDLSVLINWMFAVKSKLDEEIQIIQTKRKEECDADGWYLKR
jgi:hypothetical protein